MKNIETKLAAFISRYERKFFIMQITYVVIENMKTNLSAFISRNERKFFIMQITYVVLP